ncbi:MAG: fibronectin type III domain-containing protein, partial [Solirubrobacteraceae bacterium]
VASTAHTGTIASSTNPLQIGGDSIYGQFFAGLIDEVRVYNVALTAAQIQTDQTTPVNNGPDTTPPSQPGTLTATAVSSSEVDLSWGASTDNVGVTAYQVERCQGSNCTSFTQIATPAGTTYKDTSVSASTSYSYRVRATDAAGNLSPYSNTAGATTPTPDTTPPSQPGTLTATAVSSSEMDLSWGASTDNVGVSGYQVERCQGGGCSNFAQIATPAGTSYKDTSVAANSSYSYRVRASDSSGNVGPYSNVATASTGFTVSPGTAVLTFTRTAQFTAQGPGSGGAAWSVDGVAGGNASVGTITAGGLYTPPNSVGTHTVTATSGSQTANATVYVTNDAGTLTYHNDNMRTGQDLNETVLTPSNVKSATFGKRFSYPLDGLTLASPLYVQNVNIPGQGIHNIVIVATEHDSVYAFDADGSSSSPLWHVNFTNPAAGVTTVPAADTGETGDIPNEIGITGTPVIDPATGTIYVVAKTKEVSGGTTSYVQRLHALDLSTGAEKFGGPVVIQASVPGTGNGSSGGSLTFNSLRENQRTGLLLANGVVYFGFSSHGDNEPFHGWVLGYNASTLQRVMVHCTTPNGDDGGVWMNGDGVATDSTGSLYFISGDGLMDANSGGSDYGDSFIRLSPNGTVQDYFSPSVQTTLDNQNLDLGAGGVLLLPDQSGAHPHEMVSAGKNGTVYLVDRDNMGGYHSGGDQIVQSLTNIFPNNLGIEGGNFSSPVYWNGSVYFAPVAGPVQAFGLSNSLLTTTPTSETAQTYNGRGGTMAISANGASNGILWTLQTGGAGAPGTLHAYDATDLTKELYNSTQAGTRDTLDEWDKFSVPVVANGEVFVTSTSQLTIYGLLP